MLKNINFTSRELYVSITEKEMPVPWHTLLSYPIVYVILLLETYSYNPFAEYIKCTTS